MSYTNGAKRISDLIAATLKAGMPDLEVINVYQLPGSDAMQDYLGRFGRAALIRTTGDEFGADTGSMIERSYLIELLAILRNTEKTQHPITDLVEEIRYHIHTVRRTTVWTNIYVESTEFLELDAESIKQAKLFVRVLYNE